MTRALLNTLRAILKLTLGVLAGLGATPKTQAQAPAWQGATTIRNSSNGTSANAITAMATDAAGNVYVAGSYADEAVFNSTTFISQADISGFVAKWSPITRRFVWVAEFGAGQGAVRPVALAVNGADVYVAGGFTVTGFNWGSTFVQNPGGFNFTSEGFVSKLTDLGSSFSYGWLQRVGGTGYDRVNGLAVSGGSVYLSGTFSGTSASFGGLQLSSLGGRDGFVAKLTDAGSTSRFAWAQRLGGTGVEEGYSVAAANGNVYTTASTTSSVALGNTTLTSSGGTDGYITKLIDAGSSASFGWVEALQGAGNSTIQDVVANGVNLYIAASFTGTSASFGGIALSSSGGLDGVAGRLVDAGSTATVAWAQRFGGPYDDEPVALAESSGKLYVTGYFGSGSPVSGGLPTAFGSTQLTAAGGSDAFLTRVSDTGSTGRFDWALAAGSTADDYANAVTLLGTTACMGGFFTGSRFTIGSTVLSNLYSGNAISFVASLTDLTLSARSAGLQAGIAIFPNPAHQLATVQVPLSTGPAILTVFDIFGRAVRVQPTAPGRETVLDLTGLMPGLYTLRIQNGTEQALRPLVIK